MTSTHPLQPPSLFLGSLISSISAGEKKSLRVSSVTVSAKFLTNKVLSSPEKCLNVRVKDTNANCKDTSQADSMSSLYLLYTLFPA